MPLTQRIGMALNAHTSEYGVLKASGVVYLSTIRVVFVLSQPTATFSAFEIPLQVGIGIGIRDAGSNEVTTIAVEEDWLTPSKSKRCCCRLHAPTPHRAAQGIEKEAFKQPIFGANYLDIVVAPVPGRGLQNPTKLTLTFNQGGANTFLRIFFELMGRVHAERSAQAAYAAAIAAGMQQHQPPSALAPQAIQGYLQDVARAYVDPSDPSTIYLTQPHEDPR